MYGRYVKELDNFVRGVDIVNVDIWDKVMNGSFKKFLIATKIVRTAAYLKAEAMQDETHLTSYWYAQGEGLFGGPFSKPISREEDNCHTICSYNEKKPIWIVDKEKRPLNSEDCEYTDLLNNVEDKKIPKFTLWPPDSKDDVRTSICIPDELGRHGVINLELKPYVEPDGPIKEAIFSMAESVKLFYSMLESRTTTNKNTLLRIDELEKYAVVQPHAYFISYASDEAENAKEADHIEALLYRHERVVKRDVDKRFIGYGQSIPKKIKENIDDSDTFLVLWSQHYKNSDSDYCLSELDYAIKRKKSNNRPARVILLKIDGSEGPEIGFKFDLQADCSDRRIREININEIVKAEVNVEPFAKDE